MRAVVQRVSRAKVTVADEVTGEIGRGLLVLVGAGQGDSESDVRYVANKVAGLRILADEQGRMNLSLADIGGEVLVVSQFTLFGDTRKGRRPGFSAAADAETARRLYELFLEEIRAAGLVVATGRFQTEMAVELVNEGPVTILIDSSGDF